MQDYSVATVPSGALKTLSELDVKYKMGVVTSRIRRGAFDALRAKKMQKYFDVIVAFEDYSRPKPDLEPIFVAMKKLGSRSEETVYIGDAMTDIKAANSAGVRFIAYRSRLEGCRLRAMSYRQIPRLIENMKF